MVCIVAHFRMLRCKFYACLLCLIWLCLHGSHHNTVFVLLCKYRVFVAYLWFPVACYVLHDGSIITQYFVLFFGIFLYFVLLCFAMPFGLFFPCVLSLCLSICVLHVCVSCMCVVCVCVSFSVAFLCVSVSVSFPVACLCRCVCVCRCVCRCVFVCVGVCVLSFGAFPVASLWCFACGATSCSSTDRTLQRIHASPAHPRQCFLTLPS